MPPPGTELDWWNSKNRVAEDVLHRDFDFQLVKFRHIPPIKYKVGCAKTYSLWNSSQAMHYHLSTPHSESE